MKKYHLLAIWILIFACSITFGQKSCLNTLREAKDLYEQGLIDEIPDLLSGCMESGFTRAQRIEAYKIIILTYLFDDDQFAAEKMMDEFRITSYNVCYTKLLRLATIAALHEANFQANTHNLHRILNVVVRTIHTIGWNFMILISLPGKPVYNNSYNFV